MCSIGEDDFGDEGGLHTMHPDPVPTPATPLCAGGCTVAGDPASSNPAIVKLPCKDPQCAQCFLAYVRHKFRANLGANKMIPRGGRVLVCYDGAANSSALLDMIRFGTQLDRFKKLHIDPCVLYIDEHCLGTASESCRRQRLHTVRELLQQFGLDAYYVSVADATAATCQPVELGTVVDATADTTEEPAKATERRRREVEFAATVGAFGTLTARQEFVHCVRTNVLRACAERLDCGYAFTADTCPDLAVKLLANIALGRGSSVADDVSFCDGRGIVRILRPIRDFSALEIELYVRLAAVRCCSADNEADAVHAYGALNDEFGSVQNLTRSFVDGLQADYQSTISTVFRTGSKIAANAAGKKAPRQQQQQTANADGGRCVMCASALDCEGSETLLAVEFSRQCVVQQRDDDDGAADVDEWRLSACYGCRNVFRDVKDAAARDNAVKLLNVD